VKNIHLFNILNIFIISGMLGLLPAPAAADTYILDPDHSAVIFRIKHFGMDFMPHVVGDKVLLTISVEGVRE